MIESQLENPAVEATVVCLLNFFAPNMIAVCQAWSPKVRQLIILLSVKMEGNRAWHAEDGGLDVRVQKTWTRSRTDRHPGGFSDINYVHVPLDTLSQLRRARPDVVVSTELGMRTIQSFLYCSASGWFGLRRRRCQLVIAISTSPWIEASRSGRLRTLQRRWLLRRGDAIAYHGPQCREWLENLGVAHDKLFPFIYAADPSKIHTGPIESVCREHENTLRLLTVGQLIARKGIHEGFKEIAEVACRLPELKIHWSILGDGPLIETLRAVPLPENLNVDFRGNVNASEIRDAYRQHEMMFFPTRGDEWGLVVDEALHSGLVVIGNDKAQAVVTLIRDDVNGYLYEPGKPETLLAAIQRYTARDCGQRVHMRSEARISAADRTPEIAAQQITDVVSKLRR
jgi:glycosyltransferase involved in cell wall biosynthesis